MHRAPIATADRVLRIVRGLLAALALAAALPAPASEPLRLAEGMADVDAWPAVTVLADADGRLDVDEVLQRRARFEPPDAQHANFGVRRDVLWMRVPLDVGARADSGWLASIDYASLDRVDLYLVADGQVVQHERLGDELAFAQRRLELRPFAAALELVPGRSQELLLRVQTTSTMLVPLRLVQAGRLGVQEASFQMVQGLAAGMMLCLALYALGQWAGRRDPMYLYYAAMVFFVGLFFFAFHGLAPQHLWPGSAWLAGNAAPLVVLLALAAAAMLVERLLDVRQASPRVAKALFAVTAVSLIAAALFATGLISYRVAHLAGNALGLLPMLLALPVAYRRVREGDQSARYILLGWACYTVGVLTMALLLRGWLPDNGWTRHAFQVGSLCEALAWLRVLGAYAVAAQLQAEKAALERDRLRAMAHTDALTGLPNRRGLDLALASALPRADAQRLLVVYLLDLDGFKAVNDRLGHDAGDTLLREVAQRLRRQLRASDVVGRLGGDEFVALAHDLPDEREAWLLGQKLVDAVKQPFLVGEHTCSIGLTVGFALAPLDGSVAHDLLRRADAAMYAGKQSGKGTVRRGGATAGLAGP